VITVSTSRRTLLALQRVTDALFATSGGAVWTLQPVSRAEGR
jgi:hypothetical protein